MASLLAVAHPHDGRDLVITEQSGQFPETMSGGEIMAHKTSGSNGLIERIGNNYVWVNFVDIYNRRGFIRRAVLLQNNAVSAGFSLTAEYT